MKLLHIPTGSLCFGTRNIEYCCIHILENNKYKTQCLSSHASDGINSNFFWFYWNDYPNDYLISLSKSKKIKVKLNKIEIPFCLDEFELI